MAWETELTGRLAIVHWMPVEMYPPTINLARHFADRGWAVTIHTTISRHHLKAFADDRVRVFRSHHPTGSRLNHGRAYMSFHCATAWRLIQDNPDAILYLEPQSSFPVFVASMIRRRTPIFVHHHEYTAPFEFNQAGMRLVRWFHRLEGKLFRRAVWISHTNRERLRLFLRDNPTADPAVARVLPNFPPAEWRNAENRAWLGATPVNPLRMVYVGSLSRSDTYIEQLVGWIYQQPAGAVTLDVFAYNVDADAHQYLSEIDSDHIRFYPGGVDYDELPSLLSSYHTGLILYRAKSLNYRHNASNKLFEYLACGLDVIFPATMVGVTPYERIDRLPRVIRADFESSDPLNLAFLRERPVMASEAIVENAADALAELADVMERQSVTASQTVRES